MKIEMVCNERLFPPADEQENGRSGGYGLVIVEWRMTVERPVVDGRCPRVDVGWRWRVAARGFATVTCNEEVSMGRRAESASARR